jgi:ketosteroid isomerase-like protein
MSEENVEVVRRCHDLWRKRDFERVLELVDPDAVFDLSRNVFNPDVYRGYDGFWRWVESAGQVWDDFEPGPIEFIRAAGDHVVTGVRISGTGRGSQVRVEMNLWQVWTVRDGKVVRMTGGYRDRDEALDAAALSEPASRRGENAEPRA